MENDFGDGAGQAHVVFLRSRRKSLILDFSLVLASQHLEHEIEIDGEQYLILLDPERLQDARAVLHAYVQENRGFHAENEAPKLDILLSPILYLIWPTAFQFGVGLSPWPEAWHREGAANAQKILAGEWWRTLTATTLHVDHAHFLSNLFSGYFMLNLLGHRLGMGLILFLGVILSMAANYLVAWTSPIHHVSIGFSTTVFAVLGLLAGVETLLLPAGNGLRFHRVNPLIAAFAVAILVGLGENVDIRAHFFGFGLGALTGLASRWFPPWTTKASAQFAFGAFAYGLYALAWGLAMGWKGF